MTLSLMKLVSTYGLFALFVGTFIEGEGVLIVVGILTGEGLFNPFSVWLTASLGAWLGHLFWFLIGRKFGSNYLLPRFKERVAIIDQVVRSHPKTAIFVLQYLYGVRIIGAIALGLTKLSFGRFLFYEAANCLVWAAAVGGVGYILGEAVKNVFYGWVRWVWIALSLIILLLISRYVKFIARREERN